ncbi:MAG: hypothetical protein M5T61_13970 [Acidimicrobiia bacterium]|nr:hypothetical protein [Acidimicrobiia bacterium]
MSETRWVDDVDALDDLVAQVAACDAYALDTEFHTERTYWPRLALVQIAWPGGIALIDPLAVDIAPIGALLGGSGTMVAHAADQDLAILERACGVGPSSLFDTQVAAGFCGHGTPSLGALVEKLLGSVSPRETASPTGPTDRSAPANAITRPPTSSTCSRSGHAS